MVSSSCTKRASLNCINSLRLRPSPQTAQRRPAQARRACIVGKLGYAFRDRKQRPPRRATAVLALRRLGGAVATGDGILVEFASVVDAVRCAVDIQRLMAERNAEVPQDRQIQFRIGLNVGDIIIDDKDIYGDGVNIAARLEGLAEPGGICASRVVRDQVRDKLDFFFEDMGEQQVKNIARPVRTHRIRLEGNDEEPTSVTVGVPTASRPPPQKPSIAVLPLPT
jgi:hypothetical protein